MRVKSTIGRILLAILTSTVLLSTSISQVQAHCHTLNDSTGDSGSSFGFTDIVATELSNNGNSIGVKITTAGNIPNSFGTTGQMVFGVMFPASLLSQNQNDTGINFITVHTKEDVTGWEGSQFIYREKLESKPWNATISLNGPTATFSIPKELIGKGELAYLVSIGLVSEDGESNDYAPNNFFSDCFAEPQVIPSSQPQTTIGGTSESTSPPPQTIAEAPKKEGNKFIEKPGVNRITKKDPGQSLILSEKIVPPATPQTIQSPSPQSQTNETTQATKPSGLAVGLVIIALMGVAAVGATNFMLKQEKKQEEEEDPCEELRQKLKDAKEHVKEREDWLKEYEKRVKEAEEEVKNSKDSKEKESAEKKLAAAKEDQKKSEELYKKAKERILKLIKELEECEKKLKTVVDGKDSATGGQGTGVVPKGEEKSKSGCKQGDLRIVGSKSRKYHFLDPNREIYIETDHKMPDTGDDGKNLAKIFKGLKLLAKGAAMVGSGHPASIPVSAIAAMLGMAGDVGETLPKIKGKFKVLYLEIPMVSQTYVCEKQEICAGNKWVPRTEIIPKLPQVPYEKKIDFPSIMVEDIPSFIKKLMRDGEINNPNQVDPCKESAE